MHNVMITGATGSIGIALTKLCIEKNVGVYILCRKNSARKSRIPQNPLVHVVECDLGEMNSVEASLLPKMDAFFHLGWAATIGADRNNAQLQLQNVQYTLDAVELAKRLRCEVFVGAGSQAEYGRFEGKLDDMVPAFPETGYGIAKLCAGQMSRLKCAEYGIRHIWARILSVYGPNDSDMTMISTLIRKLLKGEKCSLTKGEQQWDYLYCMDAARALFLLAEKGKNNKIYCLGSGVAKPLREYISIVQNAIDPDALLGLGDVPYGPNQVMYLCADITALQEDTGFFPQVTFEEGIQETIAWMSTRDGYEKN